MIDVQTPALLVGVYGVGSPSATPSTVPPKYAVTV